MSRNDRVPDEHDSFPPDLPLDEGQLERERPLASERGGEDSVDQVIERPERESPADAGDDAGVESPPNGADRANLLP